MHFQWMTQVLKLGINKDVVLLLCMLVLFRPDAPSPVLEKTFAHFMHLLKMYLRVKMGASVCQAVFVQVQWRPRTAQLGTCWFTESTAIFAESICPLLSRIHFEKKRPETKEFIPLD